MTARLPYLELLQVDAVMPRTEAGFWRVILDLDGTGPWSAGDVVKETQANPGGPRQIIRRLLRAGLVEQVGERMMGGRNPQPAPLYRLTARPVEMPRLNDDGSRQPEHLRDTIWRSIKMAKEFTIAEMTSLCSTEERPANRNAVGTYLNLLVHAGVLAKVPTAERETRYRLIQNVGHMAPRIVQGRMVYDPNQRKVLGRPELREVAQ